jgi:chemotaxis protein MotB
MIKLWLAMLSLVLMTSCVSNRKFHRLGTELETQKELYGNLSEILEQSRKNTYDSERSRAVAEAEIRAREALIATKDAKNKDLENQIEFLRANNDKLLGQMKSWNEKNNKDSETINRLVEQIDELNNQLKKCTHFR